MDPDATRPSFTVFTEAALKLNNYSSILPHLDAAPPISSASFRYERAPLDVSASAVSQYRIVDMGPAALRQMKDTFSGKNKPGRRMATERMLDGLLTTLLP